MSYFDGFQPQLFVANLSFGTFSDLAAAYYQG
jgi:hypothetical protein